MWNDKWTNTTYLIHSWRVNKNVLRNKYEEKVALLNQ